MLRLAIRPDGPVRCRPAVTVDGVTAREEDQYCFGRDYLIEVLVSNDIRLYLIDVLAHAPLADADRARFDRFLASFKFAGQGASGVAAASGATVDS
jgi:hypothetical protein